MTLRPGGRFGALFWGGLNMKSYNNPIEHATSMHGDNRIRSDEQCNRLDGFILFCENNAK